MRTPPYLTYQRQQRFNRSTIQRLNLINRLVDQRYLSPLLISYDTRLEEKDRQLNDRDDAIGTLKESVSTLEGMEYGFAANVFFLGGGGVKLEDTDGWGILYCPSCMMGADRAPHQCRLDSVASCLIFMLTCPTVL